MYDILKQICIDNGWGFFYGRRDFQNLQSDLEDTDKIYSFLDPVVIDNKYGEYGSLESSTHTGSFMLLKSSELDEGYEDRYLTDIKPLIEEKVAVVMKVLSCGEYTINNIRTTEVINLFDYGYDGVVINYSITK